MPDERRQIFRKAVRPSPQLIQHCIWASNLFRVIDIPRNVLVHGKIGIDYDERQPSLASLSCNSHI